MTEQPKIHVRVNTATTSKGLISFETTSTINDPAVSAEEIMAAEQMALGSNDRMIAALNARYGKAQADGESLYKALSVDTLK